MTSAALKAEKEKEAKIKAELEAERATTAASKTQDESDSVAEPDAPGAPAFATYKDMLNRFSAPRCFLDGHCKMGDVLELLAETFAANGTRLIDGKEVNGCNQPCWQPIIDLLAGKPPAVEVTNDGANIGINNVPTHMANRVTWYAQLNNMDVFVPVPADGQGVPSRTISDGGQTLPRS